MLKLMLATNCGAQGVSFASGRLTDYRGRGGELSFLCECIVPCNRRATSGGGAHHLPRLRPGKTHLHSLPGGHGHLNRPRKLSWFFSGGNWWQFVGGNLAAGLCITVPYINRSLCTAPDPSVSFASPSKFLCGFPGTRLRRKSSRRSRRPFAKGAFWMCRTCSSSRPGLYSYGTLFVHSLEQHMSTLTN